MRALFSTTKVSTTFATRYKATTRTFCVSVVCVVLALVCVCACAVVRMRSLTPVDKTQRLKHLGMPRLGDFNKFYGGAMAGVRSRPIVALWPTFAARARRLTRG